jgi:hypothetical protein
VGGYLSYWDACHSFVPCSLSPDMFTGPVGLRLTRTPEYALFS